MTKERYEFLMSDIDASLTQQEIDEGYHFCPEWDGLLIHKNDAESEYCSCEEHTEEQKISFAKGKLERDAYLAAKGDKAGNWDK